MRVLLSVVAAILFSAASVSAADHAPDGGLREGNGTIYCSIYCILSANQHLNDLTEPQTCPTYATILSSAYSYLNRQANKGVSAAGKPYYFTQPSLFKYGAAQWLWDSSGAIIANVHRNIEDAKAEFRTLMNAQ
ncbi:hypothetical protein HDU97_004352, partial [Phlyctochytrium planicorne]